MKFTKNRFFTDVPRFPFILRRNARIATAIYKYVYVYVLLGAFVTYYRTPSSDFFVTGTDSREI